mgnify:CR=1 FL=1
MPKADRIAGGSDRPLRGILQGNGGSKKGQDAVSPELVHGALVVVDLVDEDFEDLVHERKGFIGTQSLRERREALHVAEHDGDLPPLPLNSLSLGEDFFGEPFGEVTLKLFQLFVERKGWFGDTGRRGQSMPAFATEFELWGVQGTASQADDLEFRAAILTSLRALRILKLASRALHRECPREENGRR